MRVPLSQQKEQIRLGRSGRPAGSAGGKGPKVVGGKLLIPGKTSVGSIGRGSVDEGGEQEQGEGEDEDWERSWGSSEREESDGRGRLGGSGGGETGKEHGGDDDGAFDMSELALASAELGTKEMNR